MSVRVRARFSWARADLAVLSSLVHPGDTAVDVGAFKGFYTGELSRLVGSTGTIHAFEPQPDLVRFLGRAFRQQRQVVIHPCALSDHSGAAQLMTPDWGGAPMPGHATLESDVLSGLSRVVHTERLDALDLAPEFIKIDVEGHEAAVIRGGLETIKQHQPAILLEINRSEHARHVRRLEELLALMAELRYRPSVAGSHGELLAIDAARLWSVDDPIADEFSRDFVFLPARGAGRTSS